MKDKILNIVSQHTQSIGKAKTLEDLAELENTIIDKLYALFSLHGVSKSIATEYAEFCVRCDREKLPLLCLEDYIKQYCC